MPVCWLLNNLALNDNYCSVVIYIPTMIYYLQSIPFHSVHFTVPYITLHYDTILSIKMYLNVTTRAAYYNDTCTNWPNSITKYELSTEFHFHEMLWLYKTQTKRTNIITMKSTIWTWNRKQSRYSYYVHVVWSPRLLFYRKNNM